MMMDLRSALASRGIDNPDTILASHPPVVVERSIEAWDKKRRAGSVGAGLLVQMIRNGGPAEREEAAVLRCYVPFCRVVFDPSQSRIGGRKVCPAAYCNDCLGARFKAGCWQEQFMYDVAKEAL